MPLTQFTLNGPGDPIPNVDQNRITRLFRDRLYENFTPIGYGRGLGRFLQAIAGKKSRNREVATPIRNDAWALYLGLDQENNSFHISEYKPTRSKNRNSIYYDSPKIKRSLLARNQKGLTSVTKKVDGVPTSVSIKLGEDDVPTSVLDRFLKTGKDSMVVSGSEDNVLGNFTLSKGKDKRGRYVSYYDVWDLKGAGPIGKPFETYGRIYEDELPEGFKFPQGGSVNNTNMPFNIDPGALPPELFDLMNQFQNILSQERRSGQTNPLLNLEQFRVNAFRGFKAQKGGPVLFKKTKLTPSEEKAFKAWAQGEDPTDYDLRGFYRLAKEFGELTPNVNSLFENNPDFHFPSIGLNGKILKSDKHPTRGRTMLAEELLGNKVRLTDQGLTSMPRQFPGGGMAGSLPLIPATFRVDTINNTPSNIPGGAGGKFDPSIVSLQENEVFTVPTQMPFLEPIFGNKMMHREPFHRLQMGGPVDEFSRGGRIRRRGRRVQRRLDRLQAKGKGDSRRAGRLQGRLDDIAAGGRGQTRFGTFLHEAAKGIPDFALSQFGFGDIIDNSFVDRSKFLTGATNTLSQIGTAALNVINPLAGAGLAAAQGLSRNLFGEQPQMQGMQGFGQIPGLGQFGQTPGFTGLGTQPFTTGSMLQGLMPSFQQNMFSQLPTFQHGGPASLGLPMLPIQTEAKEMFIFPDLMISKVNADKKHKQMDDDLVTDVVPEGTYIASNDPKIKMKRKDAEEIIMGIKTFPYKENDKAKMPEEIGFDKLWGSEKRDLTAAELVAKIQKRYEVIDKGDDFDFDFKDLFTEMTNQENKRNRAPWLQEVIRFNESRRPQGPIGVFKDGGPVKLKNVHKAQGGDFLNIAATLLPAILPALGQLFPGKDPNTGFSGAVNQFGPMINTGVPLAMDQANFQANVNARDAVLGQGIQDFTGLGQSLNQLAMGTAGAGIAGNLLQETNLPRFNFDAARSRLRNFNFRTPRSFAEALATPRFDTRAVLQELGPRRGGTALVGLEGARQRALNEAMINQFNQDRGMEFNVLQGMNQLDIGEQQGNIPLQVQEIAARNARTSGVFGQMGDLFNRFGQIQSSLLPITTGLNMQRANLVGQPGMRAAQNMLNAQLLMEEMRQRNQQQAGAAGVFNQLGQSLRPNMFGQSSFPSFGPNSPIFGGIPGTRPLQGLGFAPDLPPILGGMRGTSPIVGSPTGLTFPDPVLPILDGVRLGSGLGSGQSSSGTSSLLGANFPIF